MLIQLLAGEDMAGVGSTKSRRPRRPVQQELPFRTHGGKRKGAGRKPRPDRVGFVPHVTRPPHSRVHAVHVTMRAVKGVPSMRTERLFRVVQSYLVRVAEPNAKNAARRARVVHFSVQTNHLHLVVEGEDASAIARGIQGLASSIARSLNRQTRRKGRWWRDRYHRRDITSPRQARRALVYVLQNAKKHGTSSNELDPLSSAAWFAGWKREAEPALLRLLRAPPVKVLALLHAFPVRKPRTWLLTEGWKRGGGLVGANERPQAPA